MSTVFVIDSSDDIWIKGHTNHYSDLDGKFERRTDWVKIQDDAHKKSFWFTYPPEDSFALCGMIVGKENADYIQKMFERDWTDGVYYFYGCCNGTYDLRVSANDIAKLLINDIASILNELGLDHPKKLISNLDLNLIAQYIFGTRVLEKKYFREIVLRGHAGEILSDVLGDKKYQKADSSFIDETIKTVLKENETKLDGSDKILNWLVGQVMKRTQGKANAAEVKEKLLKEI